MDKHRIYFKLPAKKANLILLILESQNIKADTQNNNGQFDILVDAHQAETALNAVEQYHMENRLFNIRHQIQNIPASSFYSVTAFIIMGILCTIHALCRYYDVHDTMVLKYGASALYILQGENFRAVTALFFHADMQHLLGNMAGLIIFAAPVIRILGYGTGPFALLFCGTAGNLMNALLYQTAHLSIGASTSVMAAAGLLCTFQVLYKSAAPTPKTIAPVISGAILVALFSQGENTDVWAHIFGFLCGLVSGLVFFPLNRTIQSSLKQPATLSITLLIILSAGLAAI